jgi:small subunit ribosomal protein S21|tara:strand:+ start:751 stop:1047 length:297 start_codon:yes stop_codon:yes gene_type:complete
LKRTNDSNKNFKGPRGGGFSGDRTKTPGLYVEVRNNDINFALRKFKKKVQEAGIIQEVRERGHYVKPSEKRAKAKAAGIARWKKKQAKENEKFGGGNY